MPRPAAAPEQELEPVPSWVTDGWYGNNPGLQKLAILRWREPKTAFWERELSKAFVLPPSQPCTGCGRYAFSEPTLCFWCRKGRAS